MYFTQNLLENWILEGNLVVDKTLRKLRKATTSTDNDICYNCYQRWSFCYNSCASRTSSRTHFEVLGLGLEGQVLGLEASSPRKLACPRLKDSTIF